MPPASPSHMVRSAAPDSVECPGTEVCVVAHDSAILVMKRDWPYHYRVSRSEGASRVGEILEEERTSVAVGHCSLAGAMPDLYSSRGSFSVDVPPADAPGARPSPVTPMVANAHLRSEYAFIDIEAAESMAWFSDDEVQRMARATFEEPQARYVKGSRMVEGNRRRTLDLLVVFSPESEHVYVLERSREVPAETHPVQGSESREDAQALVTFVQALGLTQLSFDATAACAIPRDLGGSEWMPLRLSDLETGD